ncbi:uncharacterized protein LOC116295765 [Actinia tenebrosa]|uniref:Uncharacterized protein LOC116295765 n=1 Tax=Actinia tenebrosa TaxID=6105 RepID=A0A6P8I420_ACTTE|nr:uncharacterized protein LOC116295765 [Actinia tenebrosa]
MALALVGMLMVLSTCTPAMEARVRSPERPVVPNVTATSPTEIKMSWCRVKPNNIEIDHYELYIDNELEYSGIDVMYVAKRLKPWTWYEVKLRSCGFQPGFTCSPFSRPKLVKTLADGENATAIPSTATVFKVVVLPTYMFIAGVLVGVVVLAMALVWRYLKSNDLWMIEPAFELPTHLPPRGRTCLNGKIAKLNSFQLSNLVGQNKDSGKTDERRDLGKENVYHQITETEEGICSNNKSIEDFTVRKQETVLEEMEEERLSLVDLKTIAQDGTMNKDPRLGSDNNHLNSHYQNEYLVEKPYSGHLDEQVISDGSQEMKPYIVQDNSFGDLHFSPNLVIKENNVEGLCSNSEQQESFPKCERKLTEHDLSVQQADQVKDTQMNQTSSSSSGSQDVTKGAVIVVDNSNIYIGAQECASAYNAGERKRHVRVKLQNLVKILEKNRSKERTFVCGSSPPATEHVWDIYRHLGYVVDLEDRRGKDEQRVDEGLHLFIYKAICELSPRVLVLASGDGMKGKSENSTSFPGCAMMALEKGWLVEVHSWKHSLSAEWYKLAKKYPEHLSIHYLDKYVNHITFVDGKHGRKCLPLTGIHERERMGSFESRPGRLTYHNG